MVRVGTFTKAISASRGLGRPTTRGAFGVSPKAATRRGYRGSKSSRISFHVS
jgi:hypothetical protein